MERFHKNKSELILRIKKLRKYIISNFVYFIIFAFIVSLIYTGFFIVGLSATGELDQSFRVAENTVMIVICVFSIITSYIKAHLERFEFSREMFRFEYYFVPIGFGLLSVFGNLGWIFVGIVLSITIIPFANRSTLTLLLGKTPIHLQVNLLSPTKNIGNNVYLIGKEIANKKLLDIEANWNIINKRLKSEGVLDIPKNWKESAKEFKNTFPLLKVYYAEDQWDSLDKYLVYHFTKQDIDDNYSFGKHKVIMGFSGIQPKESEISLQGVRLNVLKFYVFDFIPTVQETMGLIGNPFPNSQLLENFTENILGVEKRFNKLDELEERLLWSESQRERLIETIVNLKETYGSENRRLMSLLGRHKNEIGMMDLSLEEKELTTFTEELIENKFSISAIIGIIIFLSMLMVFIFG